MNNLRVCSGFDGSIPTAPTNHPIAQDDFSYFVPLLRELRDMLKIEREKNPAAEFVFIRSRQPISSFYKAWKSACDRAKLPGLLFHDFRRTGVRNLVRAGVPERVAMAI